MTPQALFEKLSDANLTLDQALVLTDKVVASKTAGLDIVRAVSELSTPLVYAALAGPPVLGYMGGKSLARGFDATSDDVAEIQEDELISELRANAEAIRRRRALRGDGSEEEGKIRPA